MTSWTERSYLFVQYEKPVYPEICCLSGFEVISGSLNRLKLFIMLRICINAHINLCSNIPLFVVLKCWDFLIFTLNSSFLRCRYTLYWRPLLISQPADAHMRHRFKIKIKRQIIPRHVWLYGFFPLLHLIYNFCKVIIILSKNNSCSL